MQPELLALIAQTFIVAGLVGILVYAVLRLRRRDEAPGGHGERLSEEAFMATTIREAMGQGPAPRRDEGNGPQTVSGAPDPRAILDGLPAGLLVLDGAGVVRQVNRTALRLLALTPPGTGHAYRHALRDHPQLAALLDEALRTRQPMSRVAVALHAPTAGASSGSAGSAPRASITVDVTRLDSSSGALVCLLHEAAGAEPDANGVQREVNQQIATMVSGLTHELANSLTAMYGYVRLIDSTSLNEADRSALDTVLAETASMSATLEAFKRAIRRPELRPEDVPLSHLVDDVVALVRDELGVSPGGIVSAVPPGLDVHGDHMLLEEALAHVVRNAVEACSDANMAVRVDIAARPDDARGVVDLTIRDRGPGVPGNLRRKLFQPFFSTKPKRSGFGLSRARTIVRAHGTDIDARHPEDGGLAIVLQIPLAESAASPANGR